MLDTLLSQIGDDPSITASLVDQIIARIEPSIGDLGARPTTVLVIFLDPVSFNLVDLGGNRAMYDLQAGQVDNNIPDAFVEVGRNFEASWWPMPSETTRST